MREKYAILSLCEDSLVEEVIKYKIVEEASVEDE